MQAITQAVASELARGISTGVVLLTGSPRCPACGCSPVISCPACPDCAVTCPGGTALSTSRRDPDYLLLFLIYVVTLLLSFALGYLTASVRPLKWPRARAGAAAPEPPQPAAEPSPVPLADLAREQAAAFRRSPGALTLQ